MKRPKVSKVVAFIDGASRGNPGPAAIGVVLQESGGKVLKDLSVRIGVATNNVAEYYALIFALQEAMIMKVSELEVFTDSELVARQFSGQYKIKESSLQVLFLLVKHLREGFGQLTLTHVPRERNKIADRLANQALDQGSLL